ncbi:Uncharacterized protein PBTT_02640 [Plasmodiophora brassicae]
MEIVSVMRCSARSIRSSRRACPTSTIRGLHQSASITTFRSYANGNSQPIYTRPPVSHRPRKPSRDDADEERTAAVVLPPEMSGEQSSDRVTFARGSRSTGRDEGT